MSKKGKKPYFQSFKDDYSKKFLFIKPSKQGEKFAFCEICRSDFAISHSGRYDIVKHIKTEKHIKNEKISSSSAKLDSFFKDNNQSDVIKAELLFTSFLVEHNIPLSAADHVGPLFRKMFPKSEVAKQYGCARTKTSALIGEMACSKVEDMVKCLKNSPFAAACDGSNDSDFKLYPIVVTYFDISESLIKSSLFSIPNLTGNSTGENISNLIMEEFQRYGIPLQNMIAFMADNAAVMQGKKNGVITFLKNQHSNLIAMGCACHLINLASEKGAATLPIQIDEILVDIFYYLQKSAKRKEKLQSFQALHNKEAKKILKHSCTRWLSLGRSLLRLVNQWDPLLSFFKDGVKSQSKKISPSLSTYVIPQKSTEKKNKSEKVESMNKLDKTMVKSKRKSESANFQNSSKKRKNCTSIVEKINISGKEAGSSNGATMVSTKKQVSAKSANNILSREEKLFMFLSSEENKAYCLFLLNVLPIFDNVNTLLQSGTPYIHKLQEIYLDLLKELYSRFLKPAAVKEKELVSIKYHEKDNHKLVADLIIGHETSLIIEKLSEVHQENFYKSVFKFYITSCDYIINKFPITNETLKYAEVADLEKIENATFSSILYFIKMFPCMLKEVKGSETSEDSEVIDELKKEFCALQIENIDSITNSKKRIDAQWVEVGNLKNASGTFKFKKISQIMLSLLLIPHSNAECERIFSMVKKNRNEFRSSMSNRTLESLLILKTNDSKLCYEQSFNQEFLSKAKKATYSSLKCGI